MRTRNILLAIAILLSIHNTAETPIFDLQGHEVELHTETIKEEIKPTLKRNMEVTAYTAGDGYTPGVTMANGERVHVGAIACNDYPIGTIIEIDGTGYTVKDRMLNDGMIDIYMDSYNQAIKFGRQTKQVTIKE